jgi:hypothetical protein
MPHQHIRAAAELEALIKAHQPDDNGHCEACAKAGDTVRYPCAALIFCESVADRLARRVTLSEAR